MVSKRDPTGLIQRFETPTIRMIDREASFGTTASRAAASFAVIAGYN
jgi:hypothetical protein